MKLNLSNRWVMKLYQEYGNRSTCSIIRRLLLRSAFTLIMIAVVGVAGVTVAGGFISALIVVCIDPHFFTLTGSELRNYFGTEWYHGFLAFATCLGGMVGVLGTIVSLLIVMCTTGREKLATKLNANQSYVAMKESASSVYHKFCPQIEWELPMHLKGFVAGARVVDPETHVEGTVVRTSLNPTHFGVVVNWGHCETYCTLPLSEGHYTMPIALTPINQ